MRRAPLIALGLVAAGAVFLAIDRCATVRDLRTESEAARSLRTVMAAQREILQWERHLFNPGGTVLAEAEEPLHRALTGLAGVEGNEARYWEARAHLDRMNYDEAVSAVNRCSPPVPADALVLKARALRARFRLRLLQLQFVYGGAHMAGFQERTLAPMRDEAREAFEAAAASAGISPHDRLLCGVSALQLAVPQTREMQQRIAERIADPAFQDPSDPEVERALGDSATAAQRTPGDYLVVLEHVAALHDRLVALPSSETQARALLLSEAMRYAESAAAYRPDRPEVFSLRGFLWKEQARRASEQPERAGAFLVEAVEDFDRARDRARTAGVPMDAFHANRAGAYLMLADHLIRTGRAADAPSKLDLATEAAREALKLDAKNLSAVYAHARADHLLAGLGAGLAVRLPRAIAGLEEVLAGGDPGHVETRLHLGEALNHRGTINRGSSAPEALRAAAADFDRSAELMTEVLEARPDQLRARQLRAVARLGRARAAESLGEDAEAAYAAALEEFDAVVEARPGDAGSVYDSGEAHFWSGLYRAGRADADPIDFLAAAMERFERSAVGAQASLMLATCRHQSASYRKLKNQDFAPQAELALGDVERAIGSDPRYADAYLVRGGLRALLGRVEEARADYEQVAQLDPARRAAMDEKIRTLGDP